jgi:hypothetical protein
MDIKTIISEKVLTPILDQLKQGVSLHKLSLSIAFGIVVGISPIIGLTTLLCIILAYIFKLNHIAIQVSNYAAYPLQLLLLVPFITAGEHIFPKNFEIGKSGMQKYIFIAIKGATAWMIIAPLVFILVYFSSRFFLRRVKILNNYN